MDNRKSVVVTAIMAVMFVAIIVGLFALKIYPLPLAILAVLSAIGFAKVVRNIYEWMADKPDDLNLIEIPNVKPKKEIATGVEDYSLDNILMEYKV